MVHAQLISAILKDVNELLYSTMTDLKLERLMDKLQHESKSNPENIPNIIKKIESRIKILEKRYEKCVSRIESVESIEDNIEKGDVLGLADVSQSIDSCLIHLAEGGSVTTIIDDIVSIKQSMIWHQNQDSKCVIVDSKDILPKINIGHLL